MQFIVPDDTASFPHCDPDVLHAPDTCVVCDLYPERQAERTSRGVNFTGEDDMRKEPCPATIRRSAKDIHQWYGNRPYRDEEE